MSLGLFGGEEEQGSRSLQGGRVEIGDGLTHHRASADDLGGVLRNTSEIVDDVAKRSADSDEQVGLLRETLTGHSHRIVNQRFVLLHSVIDGKSRGDVLDDSANIDRQSAGLHLTVHHSVNQLFLTTFRIFLHQRKHHDAVELR